MSEREVMELTLVRQEVEVKLTGADGSPQIYTLREMDGTTRDKYLKEQMNKVTRDASGKPTGLKDITGMYAKLIAMHLFDSDGNAVKEEFIQTFPGSTQQALFERAQKLSGLDKGAEEREGND